MFRLLRWAIASFFGSTARGLQAPGAVNSRSAVVVHTACFGLSNPGSSLLETSSPSPWQTNEKTGRTPEVLGPGPGSESLLCIPKSENEPYSISCQSFLGNKPSQSLKLPNQLKTGEERLQTFKDRLARATAGDKTAHEEPFSV